MPNTSRRPSAFVPTVMRETLPPSDAHAPQPFGDGACWIACMAPLPSTTNSASVPFALAAAARSVQPAMPSGLQLDHAPFGDVWYAWNAAPLLDSANVSRRPSPLRASATRAYDPPSDDHGSQPPLALASWCVVDTAPCGPSATAVSAPFCAVPTQRSVMPLLPSEAHAPHCSVPATLSHACHSEPSAAVTNPSRRPSAFAAIAVVFPVCMSCL